MPDLQCAQCAQPFTALGWTRACPHCGSEKAARCTECDTSIRLGTRTCAEHTPAPVDQFSPPGPAAPRYRRVGPSAAAGEWSPRPRRRRRWPRLVLAGVLLGAAAGGTVFAVETFRSDYPKEWDPRVKDLAAFVERERGLSFDHPVHVDFLSDAAFRAQATEHDDPTKEDRARIESFEAMLRAVGLLSGDVDLLKIGEELVGDGTVGLYRFDDERITVRGETLDDERRSTLVHELTHALQDQNFDIGDLEPDGSGAEVALRTVVEADADDVMEAWEATLSEDARRKLQEAQQGTAGGADFAGVPEVFIELMSFPYDFGPDLLQAVVAKKGLAGRNSLFTDPPVSEEQVILPDTYLAGQAVKKVKTPALASGETLIKGSADDFGMVSLLVVLAERIDYSLAWRAVQGWAGDAVVAFERGDDTCVRMEVAFDEAGQAERFEAAFARWSQAFATTHSREDRSVKLESCDPGTDGPAGRPEGHVSGIRGLAYRRALINTLQAVGAPADRAACIADGALDRVGADRFAELDRAATENPRSRARSELEAAGAQAAQACP